MAIKCEAPARAGSAFSGMRGRHESGQEREKQQGASLAQDRAVVLPHLGMHFQRDGQLQQQPERLRPKPEVGIREREQRPHAPRMKYMAAKDRRTEHPRQTVNTG